MQFCSSKAAFIYTEFMQNIFIIFITKCPEGRLLKKDCWVVGWIHWRNPGKLSNL